MQNREGGGEGGLNTGKTKNRRKKRCKTVNKKKSDKVQQKDPFRLSTHKMGCYILSSFCAFISLSVLQIKMFLKIFKSCLKIIGVCGRRGEGGGCEGYYHLSSFHGWLMFRFKTPRDRLGDVHIFWIYNLH